VKGLVNFQVREDIPKSVALFFRVAVNFLQLLANSKGFGGSVNKAS